MGKKGGIFEEWFKNLAILIFLQSGKTQVKQYLQI